MCLDEYPMGVMVEMGDFCLVAPLCLLNHGGEQVGEGSRDHDADGIMYGNMVVTGMNSSVKSVKFFFRFLYQFGGLCFILPFSYRIALGHSAQTETS